MRKYNLVFCSLLVFKILYLPAVLFLTVNPVLLTND
jgi:hypothetical protein